MSRKGQEIKQKVQDLIRRCGEASLPKLITASGREAKARQEEKGRIRSFLERFFKKEPEEPKEQWSPELDKMVKDDPFDRRSVDFYRYRAFDKR